MREFMQDSCCGPWGMKDSGAKKPLGSAMGRRGRALGSRRGGCSEGGRRGPQGATRTIPGHHQDSNSTILEQCQDSHSRSGGHHQDRHEDSTKTVPGQYRDSTKTIPGRMIAHESCTNDSTHDKCMNPE